MAALGSPVAYERVRSFLRGSPRLEQRLSSLSRAFLLPDEWRSGLGPVAPWAVWVRSASIFSLAVLLSNHNSIARNLCASQLHGVLVHLGPTSCGCTTNCANFCT